MAGRAGDRTVVREDDRAIGGYSALTGITRPWPSMLRVVNQRKVTESLPRDAVGWSAVGTSNSIIGDDRESEGGNMNHTV